MNILLAYKCHPEGAKDPFTSLLPVGLLSLGGVLRRGGHEVTLANLSGCSWQQARQLLLRLSPDLVGISQFTHNRTESLKLASLAKEAVPSCRVVLGGPHATHSWREQLERHRDVDVVVLGEGEETLLELVRALEQGRPLAEVAGLAWRDGDNAMQGAPRAAISELDLLPLPLEDVGETIGVDLRRQLEFVITSRGCPASCLFCSSPLFWGRGVRFRSPASVVEELRLLKERYGLIYFSFRDDTFTANRARVLEICRLIEEQRLHILWNCQSRVNAVDQEMLVAMKRAGCECIQFGVESGSPEMLKALGKKILPADVERAAAAARRAGINLSVYLITGIPGEDDEDLQQTVRLIDRIRPQDGQVSPLVYYPGTELLHGAVRRKEVPPHLFEEEEGEGFLVRRDPFVERSRQSMLKALQKAGKKARFTRADFTAQRELVGYSFVTELLQAEVLEQEGDWEGAVKLCRAMTRQEADNPWGWLQLAGLQERGGDLAGATRSYRQLARLVPNHLPAFVALGELALAQGDRAAAAGHYQRALELDPNDEAALEGAAQAGVGPGKSGGKAGGKGARRK
ncbi:B12-binding domain-containing radical SAM protein [Geomonas azotofigens]|uniref:B12-binding domain-containing radical SAM protein n=1 Tax=Geomonas azotofigens TaxID=2843196 RepID=UPI001C123AD9|nr:radical SAM protein [Geomonas azotofigens]MBU5615140.1 radical SAM protein [Geomonas azotofigens]